MDWKKGLLTGIITTIFFVSVYSDNLDGSGYPFFEASFQERPPVEIGFFPDTGWRLENETLVRKDTNTILKEDKTTQQTYPNEVDEKKTNPYDASIVAMFVGLTGIILVIVVMVRFLI